jgi:hypothetical protein
MTSGENFGNFLMMAPFSIEGASSKSGAVQHEPVLAVCESAGCAIARQIPRETW